MPAIREARRRVLEEYNLFAVLAREISRRDADANAEPGGLLYSRHALVKKYPWVGVKHLLEKGRAKLRSLAHRNDMKGLR
jgi:hypothetical protein